MKKIYLIIVYIMIIKTSIYAFNPDGKCIDGLLNIRTQPTLRSNIIGQIDTDEEFIVNEKIGFLDRIGDYSDFWYKIKTEDGIDGYIFGAFIEFYEHDYRKYVEKYGFVHDLGGSPRYRLINTEIISNIDNPMFSKKYNEEFYFVRQDSDNNNWFLVVNDKYEFGWLDINNSLIEEYSYYKNIIGIDNVDSIKNSYDEGKYYEYILKKSNQNIRRNGPILFYKEKVFLDNFVNSPIYYNIIKIQNDLQIWLRIHYSEGIRHILYNVDNDEKIIVTVMPEYFNNDDLIICFGSFYVGNYKLEILEKIDGYYNLVYDYKFSSEYYDCKDEIAQISEEKFEIIIDDDHYNLEKIDGIWSLKRIF